MSEPITSLTQEEMDAINYDAREGDLETLQAIFAEVPAHLLKTIKDDITLSTPVHMAAANGHGEVVDFLLGLLLEKDARDLASQVNDEGNTPLHWAAFNGHLPVVKLLCEKYKVDVYALNKNKKDALFEAENNTQEEVETWLLQNYAIEDGFKVETDGEDTKVTYQPGTESKEADERAAVEASKQQAAVEALKQQTAKLDI